MTNVLQVHQQYLLFSAPGWTGQPVGSVSGSSPRNVSGVCAPAMGDSQGFLAHGLVIGTITFFVIGVAASMISSTFFVKETANITKQESIRLGWVVVWVSIFSMWLMWACVYMHQMVPLMEPLHIVK